MRANEELIKDFDEKTQTAFEKANELCNCLDALDTVEIGEISTKEDKEKINAIIFERDRRKCLILKRILIEYGNLLFL